VSTDQGFDARRHVIERRGKVRNFVSPVAQGRPGARGKVAFAELLRRLLNGTQRSHQVTRDAETQNHAEQHGDRQGQPEQRRPESGKGQVGERVSRRQAA
jgi:hypothetical protein